VTANVYGVPDAQFAPGQLDPGNLDPAKIVRDFADFLLRHG
jgi:hypothetical protein